MTQEMKHTPGPWEVGDLDQNSQRIVRSEHIEICTCWHHCVGSIEKQMEANARLIAAAPEMYEALKAAEEWLSGWASAEPYLETIRAALLKAEGR